MAAYSNNAAPELSGFGLALMLAAEVLFLALAILLQIIIHEAGHLVFGLLSGYKFSSFRIGSFMLSRDESGKLSTRKISIAGTAGQCLMCPPDFKEDGSLPVVLYNLGGVVFNLLTALFFLWAYFFSGGSELLPLFCLAMGIIGLGFSLMNGIPLKLGGICNDGYNAMCLNDDDDALRAFWLQLKINQLTAAGMRLREMPENWFELPNEEQMKNSLCASMAVFRANRLMDEQRFAEALELMEQLVSGRSAIPGLYISLLNCDIAYCLLLGDHTGPGLEKILSNPQLKFMKQMKDFPAVIRTSYALALLHEKDASKAKAIKQHFDSRAKTYPYPCEIQGERELMELAEKAAEPA